MSSTSEARQATMESTQLYREDIFTDRKVGTIRRLTPVTAAGADDAARPVLFVGQAQVMTPMGALPISFELDALSLDVAVSQFGAVSKPLRWSFRMPAVPDCRIPATCSGAAAAAARTGAPTRASPSAHRPLRVRARVSRGAAGRRPPDPDSAGTTLDRR